MANVDYFKESFKCFKRKNSSELLESIIDFELLNENESVVPIKEFIEQDYATKQCMLCTSLGLVSHQEWNLYSLKNINGFIYIKNPFTIQGQQYWIQRCLELYPQKPSITNLDHHFKYVDDIWSLRNDTDSIKCQYIDKLSWATLGYHHNWNTKMYNPAKYSKFPECLAKLSKHVASCLQFKTFKPEAAIVNYYNKKSNLGIHNDHSEDELNEPIISFSFGETAIFLIGTMIKTDKPTSIFLRSGDIIILSGASRLSYHAVPAILQEPVSSRYCISSDDESWKPYHHYIKTHRINISVRQVYPSNVQDIK